MIRETTRPGLGQNSCTCLAGKSLIVLASFPGGSDSKVSACSAGDPGLIPGSGRSPGEGNGNPLQYSCLENSMDGGAWLAIVHGVTKSWTRLSHFTSLHFTSLSQAPGRCIVTCLHVGGLWKKQKNHLNMKSWILKKNFCCGCFGQGVACRILVRWVCVSVCPVAQLYLTPFGPMDCSPPGSSIHGILHARVLEWVAMPTSRGSSWSRDRTRVLHSKSAES